MKFVIWETSRAVPWPGQCELLDGLKELVPAVRAEPSFDAPDIRRSDSIRLFEHEGAARKRLTR